MNIAGQYDDVQARNGDQKPLSPDQIALQDNTHSHALVQLSLTGQLCRETIGLLHRLVKSLRGRNEELLTALHYNSFERSYDRLRVWSETYKLCSGGFDHVLQTSDMVNKLVLGLLLRISEILVDGFVPLLESQPEKIPLDDSIQDRKESLQSLIQDLKEDKSDLSFESADSETSSFHSAAVLAQDLKAHSNGLLELQPLLAEPFIPQETQSQASEVHTWVPHHAFRAQIQEQFPSLSEEITMRLALANYERYMRCLDNREAEKEEAVDEEEQQNVLPQHEKPESRFHDSGVGSSIPAPYSAPHVLPETLAKSEYAATVMTYGGSGSHTSRLPRLNPSAKHGSPFSCLACGDTVTFTSDVKWKRHLLSDLQPWVCIAERCAMGHESFQTKQQWIEHIELEHELGPKWQSFRCPFCDLDTGDGKHVIIGHLGAHLEGISSAVLPLEVHVEEEHSSTGLSSLTSESLDVASITAVAETWTCTRCRPSIRFLNHDSLREHEEAEHKPGLHSNANLTLDTSESFDGDFWRLTKATEAGFRVLHESWTHVKRRPDLVIAIPPTFTENGRHPPNSALPEPNTEEQDLHRHTSPKKPNPTQGPKRLQSPLSGDKSSDVYTCKDCNKPAQFKDEHSLLKHKKTQHTRPFFCVYHFAGCTSTFAAKNEWKRHVTSQHLYLHYWVCTEGSCAKVVKSDTGSTNSRPRHFANPSLPNGTIFNRKDIYTQHLRRMHVPSEFKRRMKQSNNHFLEWEKQVKAHQKAAIRSRCQLPDYMECPLQSCTATFSGSNAWDERMEHVARHLDVDISDGVDGDKRSKPVEFGGENDRTLLGWSARPDVAVIRLSADGSSWELNYPLGTSAGPRKPSVSRARHTSSSVPNDNSMAFNLPAGPAEEQNVEGGEEDG